MVRRSKSSCIQINVIDSDKNITNTLPIIMQKPLRQRKLNHGEWDETKAIRRFCWYLSRSDNNGIDAAFEALLRLSKFKMTLFYCKNLYIPNKKKL